MTQFTNIPIARPFNWYKLESELHTLRTPTNLTKAKKKRKKS